MPWCGSTYEPAEATEWVVRQTGLWDKGKEFEFSILDLHGVLVGGCGLNEVKAACQVANLGYWLRTFPPKKWRFEPGGSGADRIVGAIRPGVRYGDASYAAMT